MNPWEHNAFNPSAYENIDLNRLAAYAIKLFEDEGISTTFERLVVTLFKLFPKKFALIDFEEYPDATRINRALLQLRPKYRNWATGKVSAGFVLTDSGRAIAEQTEKMLQTVNKNNADTNLKQKGTSRLRTRDLAQELIEIQSSSIFDKYRLGKFDEIETREVYDLLNAFPYTPKTALKKRLNSMADVALKEDRQDIYQFITWVKKEFHSVFFE